MLFSKVQKLKKIFAMFLICTLTTSLFIMVPDNTTVYAASSAPIMNMDYKPYVSTGDVDYTGIITKSQYGMPIGNGRMGSLVWNNNASSLNFQINRVDDKGGSGILQKFPQPEA